MLAVAKMEALRNQWLDAEEGPDQVELARKIQAQAMIDGPYLPLGSYFQPTAYRANVTGMARGLILFTGVRRA